MYSQLRCKPGDVLFHIDCFHGHIGLRISRVVSSNHNTVGLFGSLLRTCVTRQCSIPNIPSSCSNSSDSGTRGDFSGCCRGSGTNTTPNAGVCQLTNPVSQTTPAFVRCRIDTDGILNTTRRYKIDLASCLVTTVLYTVHSIVPSHTHGHTVHISVPISLHTFFESRAIHGFCNVACITCAPTRVRTSRSSTGASTADPSTTNSNRRSTTHATRNGNVNKLLASRPLTSVTHRIRRRLNRTADHRHIRSRVGHVVTLRGGPILHLTPSPTGS